ncbi:MAG TPA: NfeD family protein [Pyrinomonadaceae bacterium]|nr:NfeD family protein [Pyrinomonadaceae bacterium]
MDFNSLNLLTLFAAIGGIGFVFLLISFVVGDIFDALGFDGGVGDGGTEFGFLDSRVIAVFVTAFGGFGAIGVQMGFGAAASSGIGLLGGIFFGAIVSLFGRFLIGQQASSTVTDTDLVGRTAQVTVAIKGGQLGQITARIGDERVEKLARTEGNIDINAGSLVKVTAIAGDSVIVELNEVNNRGLSS